MKVNEVPQDDANFFEGKTREIQYAIDEEGKYRPIKSVGWDPKNDVMQHAWDMVNEEIDEAYALFKEGKKSPVFYYMKKNLMDLKTLADYVGIWRVFVKRHFKPSVFNSLSPSLIKKYTEIFKLESVEELMNPKAR